MVNLNWQKYLLALIITAAIFGTAFYFTSRIDSKRIADIRALEESISIDILSSEIQFELLGNLDCTLINNPPAGGPVLQSELNSLASRLSVSEQNLGSGDAEVLHLKKQYSLLEIKDYLLMEQIAQKCHLKPVFVLYFYSNAGDCEDCARAGDVLTYMHEQYPGLRVYSFDYNLDLSALKTLATLRALNGSLPAFIVNNRPPVYGFKTLDQLEALIPELKTLASSTASTDAVSY